MMNVTVFVKISGYNSFFKVNYEVRKSNKGYKVARVNASEEISKAEYYKQPPESRFIRRGIVDIGCGDIHQVGNESFFERLDSLAKR